ncbi:MAG: hypothetical protein EBR86_04300 [Planctomycetia bacterium]|nr:hypothetical protein [Planctomycetia bacterium]
MLGEEPIQCRMARMPGRPRQIGGHHEGLQLPLPPSLVQRHAPSWVSSSTSHPEAPVERPYRQHERHSGHGLLAEGRLDNVITYCRHRITNAVAEGLDSTIMAIKRRAAGYRNPANFKPVIDFSCRGPRLHP